MGSFRLLLASLALFVSALYLPRTFSETTEVCNPGSLASEQINFDLAPVALAAVGEAQRIDFELDIAASPPLVKIDMSTLPVEMLSSIDEISVISLESDSSVTSPIVNELTLSEKLWYVWATFFSPDVLNNNLVTELRSWIVPGSDVDRLEIGDFSRVISGGFSTHAITYTDELGDIRPLRYSSSSFGFQPVRSFANPTVSFAESVLPFSVDDKKLFVLSSQDQNSTESDSRRLVGYWIEERVIDEYRTIGLVGTPDDKVKIEAPLLLKLRRGTD